MLKPGFSVDNVDSSREGSIYTEYSGELERPRSRNSNRTRSPSIPRSGLTLDTNAQLALPREKSRFGKFFSSLRSTKGTARTPYMFQEDGYSSGSLTSLNTTTSNVTNDSICLPLSTSSLQSSSMFDTPTSAAYEHDHFPLAPSSLPPRLPPPSMPIPALPLDFDIPEHSISKNPLVLANTFVPSTGIQSSRTSETKRRTRSFSLFPTTARLRQDSIPTFDQPREAIIVDDEDDRALEQALEEYYMDFDYNQKFKAVPLPPLQADNESQATDGESSQEEIDALFSPGLPRYESIIFENVPEPGKKLSAHHNVKPITSSRRSSRTFGEYRNYELEQQDTFTQIIQQMEDAGVKTIGQKLNENWTSADTEHALLEEIDFEKRIWGSVGFQRLTHGRPLMSEAHKLLSEADGVEETRVLHLHGSAADGWVLAAKYPKASVYSVSSKDISTPASSWLAPTNFHVLQTSSVVASLPFPDNYVDVITSKALPATLKASEWSPVLKECYRVLKPGGWLELQIIDPTLINEGDQLTTWLDDKLVGDMIQEKYALKPSEDVTKLLNGTGFSRVTKTSIPLPAAIDLSKIPRNKGVDSDIAQLLVLVGRHLYEELYHGITSMNLSSEDDDSMWWNNKTIKQECELRNTCFGLTFSVARK